MTKNTVPITVEKNGLGSKYTYVYGSKISFKLKKTLMVTIFDV
jgi:hypothetical protein